MEEEKTLHNYEASPPSRKKITFYKLQLVETIEEPVIFCPFFI